MKAEMKFPKPSLETLRTFDELRTQLDDAFQSDDTQAADKLMGQLNDLIGAYDWDNEIFDDPVTGKKGVKNPAGEVIVPARYDAFTFVGDHNIFRLSHIAAKKDGKYGVVSVDGTGTELCEFRFDYLQWYPYTGMYVARWDGISDKFGFVNHEGKVFIPNVLTTLYEPWNDLMVLESDGKYGAFDTSTFFFVLPEYDQIDADPEELVVFHKDGKEGYIIEETGEFITREQYENDDRYIDTYVYNTYIND